MKTERLQGKGMIVKISSASEKAETIKAGEKREMRLYDCLCIKFSETIDKH